MLNTYIPSEFEKSLYGKSTLDFPFSLGDTVYSYYITDRSWTVLDENTKEHRHTFKLGNFGVCEGKVTFKNVFSIFEKFNKEYFSSKVEAKEALDKEYSLELKNFKKVVTCKNCLQYLSMPYGEQNAEGVVITKYASCETCPHGPKRKES